MKIVVKVKLCNNPKRGKRNIYSKVKCVKDWELQGDGKYIGTIRPGASVAEVPKIHSVRAMEYHPGPSAQNRP